MERGPKREQYLETTEAYRVQKDLLEGRLSEEEIVSLFERLDRPLSPDEFYGLYKASADAMIRIETSVPALDTCGTGGDGLNTFNISTAAGLLAAALDVPVAKHGNRSASGTCGSADVLEALGFNINMDAAHAAECLDATDFCFMFAQKFHPGFKHAAAARKKFGKRTYFNFLGPLLNPASAPFRVVGVSDATMIDLVGSTLVRSGVSKAWVVNSTDGMDEISPSGDTLVTAFTPHHDAVRLTINPTDYGMEKVPLEALRGGDAIKNAQIVRDVLDNRGTKAQTNAVVLNTAGALMVAGVTDTYAAGVAMAREAITNQLGIKKLEQVCAVT